MKKFIIIIILFIPVFSFADFIPIGDKTYRLDCTKNRYCLVGDSKSESFKPSIEINCWAKDSLKFYFDTSLSLNISTNLSDTTRLKWGDSNFEFTFLPISVDKIPELESMTETNGVKFRVRLNRKPQPDRDGYVRFTLKMKGHEDFNFLPQLELTQEEIDDGDIRPEWIVDSLAVYHKSKSQFEFETGKACHIYRPWCKDSKGNFTWGKWEYDLTAGTITKAIPEKAFNYGGAKWWDIDATFGNTSQGASATTIENYIKGTIDGQSPASDGTGDSITAWLNVTIAAHNCKCHLYLTSTRGKVTNGETEEKSIAVGANQEITFNFSTGPSVAAATTYDITAYGSATSGDIYLYYDNDVGNVGGKDYDSYNGFPNPWQVTQVTRKFSVYCTYTPSAAVSIPVIMRHHMQRRRN